CLRLGAIAVTAMVFAPGHLPGVPAEIWPRNVMMMAEFSAAYAAETAFRLVYAGIIARIFDGVVDTPG
ncbi:MAG: hypothetical protein P8Y36_13765, partial [Alphaproteobacteria bacterium]